MNQQPKTTGMEFTTLTLAHPKNKRAKVYCPQISVRNSEGLDINFVADLMYESLEEANTVLAYIVSLMKNANKAEMSVQSKGVLVPV